MSAHELDPPDDAPRAAADADDAAAAADAREQEAARREAELLRRDREKAQQAAAKEVERARRDREKAERAAAKEAERAQTERERALRDAERDAARAQRDAEKAVQAASLAQQRAAREVENARRRATQAGLTPLIEAPARPVRLPRDVEVLWRTPEVPRRGPRPSLTLERIAEAAVALADTEGIAAVSMARLAESLGFTTMSLYRYVSSKDEVLALMADAATGRPPAPDDAAPGDGTPRWRSRLDQLVRIQAPLLRAHPWLAHSGAALHAVGPNRLAWMEAMVAALDGTGLTEHEKVAVAALLATHALSQARVAQDVTSFADHAAGDPGGDGPPVVADYDGIIGALARPDEHPALTAATAAGAFRPDPGAPDDADFGLRTILDGVAALIAERTRA